MTITNKSAEISAPIKRRILQYVDYTGIMKKDFFSKIDISSGSFRGKSLSSEIGGDKIAKILTSFPEINPTWLLTGKGEMLLTENSGPTLSAAPEFCPNCKVHLAEIKHCREHNETLKELNNMLKRELDQKSKGA